jgi:acyl-CoA thioesterase-1
MVVLLVCPGGASAAPERVILSFGDSLSAAYGLRAEQGWAALLQQRLRSQGYGYEVVNASISGETTEGGLARLSRALDLHHPAVVLLELGANDGLRGLPVATARDNLARMIQLCQQGGASVLLLGIQLPPNYGPRYGRDFAAMYVELAAKYHVALVPFMLERVALDPALMQGDQLHPNAAGQPRVLDNIWPLLLPLLDARH